MISVMKTPRSLFPPLVPALLLAATVGIGLLGCTAKRTIQPEPDIVVPPPKDSTQPDTSPPDTSPPPVDTAVPDTTCQPSCVNKTCGDDGCGGSCGSCIGCNGTVDETLCDPTSKTCNQPCCPDCSGKICGTDGCGGTCGQCGQNMYCNDDGQCADSSGCVPDCTNKQCGDNGCGFACGICPPDQVCNDDSQCITVGEPGGPCNGIGFNGLCVEEKLFYCANNVLAEVDCAAQGKKCLPTADGSGFDCQVVSCVPECAGQNCGDDGCGGSCGTCQSNETCQTGVCTPNNTNNCGNVPTGGMCVVNVLKKCVNGVIEETDCVAEGKVCGWEPQFDLALCQSAPCTPQCSNKNCGADGCGGLCGTCPEGKACSSSQQCVAATAGSCTGLCNALYNPEAECQCDTICFATKDCCSDICIVCDDEYSSQCEGICGTSFTVGALPFSTSKDTNNATNLYSIAADTCPGETTPLGGGSNDHAWSFTAPTTALYLVTLEAQYDSILYAVSSCPVTTTSCLKANDEVGTNKTEFIQIDVQANETVYIIVDGWANTINVAGTYTLKVEYSP